VSVLAIGTISYVLRSVGVTADTVTDRPGGVSRAEDAGSKPRERETRVPLDHCGTEPAGRSAPSTGRRPRAPRRPHRKGAPPADRHQSPITLTIAPSADRGSPVASNRHASVSVTLSPQRLPAELARYLTVSMSYWPVEVISLVAGAGLSPAPTRADSGDRPDTRRLIETRSKR
jgi:hypothetical protein